MSVLAERGVGLHGIAGDTCFLARPRGHQPDPAGALVMMKGGYLTTDTGIWLGASRLHAVALALRWPMASSSFSQSDEWGNAEDVDSIEAVRVWAAGRAGVDADRVLGHGGSMGGLGMLEWAVRNPESVAALALVMPAINPQRMYDENVGGFAAAIGAAHGGRPPDDRCPFARPEEFADLELKIWGADNDPYVAFADLQAFAAGAGAQLDVVTGAGHDGSMVDPQAITDYLEPHA